MSILCSSEYRFLASSAHRRSVVIHHRTRLDSSSFAMSPPSPRSLIRTSSRRVVEFPSGNSLHSSTHIQSNRHRQIPTNSRNEVASHSSSLSAVQLESVGHESDHQARASQEERASQEQRQSQDQREFQDQGINQPRSPQVHEDEQENFPTDADSDADSESESEGQGQGGEQNQRRERRRAGLGGQTADRTMLRKLAEKQSNSIWKKAEETIAYVIVS